MFSLLFTLHCVILPFAHGALAQLVARDIRIVEVRGSTPLCSTNNPDTLNGCPDLFMRARSVRILAEDNAMHWRGAEPSAAGGG